MNHMINLQFHPNLDSPTKTYRFYMSDECYGSDNYVCNNIHPKKGLLSNFSTCLDHGTLEQLSVAMQEFFPSGFQSINVSQRVSFVRGHGT